LTCNIVKTEAILLDLLLNLTVVLFATRDIQTLNAFQEKL
jgi:hypothetical protein